MKTVKDYEAGTLRLEFPDGNSLEVKVDDLPAEIQDRLVLYGLGVKLQRATAGQKEKAFEIVSKLVDALKEGKWNVAPAPGAKTGQKAAIKQMILSVAPELRAAVVEQSRAMLEKAGFTEEEIQELLTA